MTILIVKSMVMFHFSAIEISPMLALQSMTGTWQKPGPPSVWRLSRRGAAHQSGDTHQARANQERLAGSGTGLALSLVMVTVELPPLRRLKS